MANTSIDVNVAGFDEIKQSLKSFLADKPQFSDYDFDGSNISAILDILAYNTYLNLFYYNMAANETFLDTAVIRDSVISRANELNYTPRSFRSAVATVDIAITSNNVTRSAVVIAKGTQFNARIDNHSYIFTTDRNIVTTTRSANSTAATFVASNVSIFEGQYISESVAYTGNTIIVIDNERVDVDSLSVVSIEDGGANTVTYTRATDIVDVTANSAVFFVEPRSNGRYSVVFGNGVIGRQPKTNSVISLEYRVSSGQLANDARVFAPAQTIDGETKIVVTTVTPARGGDVFESIDSIRFAAPKHFYTRRRAVVASDYTNIIKQKFPHVADVSTFGGETANPPRYGDVVISAITVDGNAVDSATRREIVDYVKRRSPPSVDCVFVDPSIVTIAVDSVVKYNPHATALTPDDINLVVTDAIVDYSARSLNKFDSTLRLSRLIAAIDRADTSIISNDTTVRGVSTIVGARWLAPSITIDFAQPLDRSAVVESSVFRFNNANVIIRAENDVIDVINVRTGNRVTTGGTVDRAKGIVSISGVRPDNITIPLQVFVTFADADITASPTTVISIDPTLINVTVQSGVANEN